jgi:transposase
MRIRAPLAETRHPYWKGGDIMQGFNVLTTLFVGIDVSSQDNVVCAINFEQQKLLCFSAPNNNEGARIIADKVCAVYRAHSFETLIFAMESTSFYSLHIANFLSSDPHVLSLNPYVYCLNPKETANYGKSFIGKGKNDAWDAFLIADFARVGRISTQPWRGSQFLALQRLTRHRLHLVECQAREKTYMVSNVFLKFSELSILKGSEHPFCSNHTATAEAILTEFHSPEDIIAMPEQDLIAFLCAKGRNHFADPLAVAAILKKAAQNSYVLDKRLYEPLNTAISSSFNCLRTFESEVKDIGKAIQRAIGGLNPTEYQCLMSIPGIGPVYSAGILAEIGSMSAFHSQEAVAKYAGLVWREKQSGNFTAEDTKLSKAGNSYLRYYLVEAANSVRRHVPEYAIYYQKKFDEVKTHQHKRALALTARKLVRLIYGLLAKNQLYSPKKAGTS